MWDPHSGDRIRLEDERSQALFYWFDEITHFD